MKKYFLLLLLFFCLLLLAFGSMPNAKKNISFETLTNDSIFIAGNSIYIGFTSNSNNAQPKLFIVHSYGKTLLECNIYKNNYIFEIPKNYIKKTGLVSWYLINNEEKVLNGFFEIVPNESTKTKIENYLGPRSILAGGSDFTMLVTVPTDGYDNPKKKNTEVLIKHQFLQNINSLQLKTNNFITWHNIYSPLKSGKLLVSTECEKISSKEIETEIFPNNATNFQVFYTRDHDYADGNQITNFTTSIIKDEFDNIVSDGTAVTFIINTNNGSMLKTFGNTINGIATAQILHPDHKDTYIVKGFVTGLAQSNPISVDYKPIIDNFEYNFSNKNRTLTVGCLKSFMNQNVPDGIKVSVKVFHENKLIATLIEDTSKGYAVFKFDKEFYKKSNYNFEISTLGITKKTAIINYEL